MRGLSLAMPVSLLPASATVLLLAARGMVGRRGRVTDKVRGRVVRALERDPRAWSVAEEQARPLGMIGALRLLRQACEARELLSPADRAAGLAAVWLHEGPAVAKARIFLDADLGTGGQQSYRSPVSMVRGKAPRRASCATPSSTLASAPTCSGLGLRMGPTSAVHCRHWTDPPRQRAPSAAHNLAGGRDPLVPTACLGHPVGQHLWMSLVVALNAIGLWRYVLTPRRGTKVVIFDRFSPDSAVKIDLHYHHNRHFDTRWERNVFKNLSPKADVAFLIAVPSPDRSRLIGRRGL